MNTVDKYILKSFLKKFIPAFFIIFFIFIVQTFWLYFDELAGKGLGGWIIFKFFLYFSPNIILNVIPLATLLAGIMTYGNLSERSEFTAIKSMGISLIRSMKHTLLFIILLSILSFAFANTIVPYGNYKFSELRRKIKDKKPSIAIKQGVFTNMQNFNIYVREKYGKDKNKLKEVLIHQKVNNVPDKTIIAKTGTILSDAKNHLVQLILNNGVFYEDLTREQKTAQDRKKYPAMKTKFKKHIINIDVSGLDNVDFDKKSKNSNMKLSFLDIKREIDTIDKRINKNYQVLSNEIVVRNLVKNYKVNKKSNSIISYNNINNLLKNKQLFTQKKLSELYSNATTKAETMLMFSKRKLDYSKNKQNRKNEYIIAFYNKFAFPISIIIMFFVGVPLGAIIRKGGYSASFVAGIVIFLIYYMMNMFGKNAGEEGKIPAWMGAWLSAFILAPLGVYLMIKANLDKEFTYLKNVISSINTLIKRKL